MPAVRLPLAAGETPQVEGAMAEQLSVLLAPVNDPTIQARLGQETMVGQGADDRGAWQVTRGETFRNQNGWVQGQRYLRLSSDGHVMAMANVTLRRQGRRTEARLSNIYVAPAHRRQGWAGTLIAQVQNDHPKLVADSCLSEAGAELIGQTAGARVTAARSRRKP